MTEKRSDYRKRQKKGLIDKVDFTKDKNEVENRRRPLAGDGQEFYQRDETIDKETVRENKSLKLKKRLNRAILLVIVLIVLVLLALFHL